MANIRQKKESSGSLQSKIVNTIQHNKTQLIFVVAVVLSMVVYYTFTGTQWFRQDVLPHYLEILARITSYLLTIFGEKIVILRTVVQSPSFAMDIAYGCDALEPITLFSVVVLCFPAQFKAKITGVLSGILFLFTLNIFRLLTLYYAGTYSYELFELFHIEIWQPVFIICALVLFLFYVGIIRKKGWANV